MFEGKGNMRRTILIWGSVLGLCGILLGCGKNEFSASTAAKTDAIPAADEYVTTTCSNATILKPKVDVVILWPNTEHAAHWASEAIKYNLIDLLNVISIYDYRVIGLPLIGNYFQNAVVASSDGSSFGNFPRSVPLDMVATTLMGYSSSGSTEAGINRLKYVATNASSWHRADAYTIFILASFMDDYVFRDYGANQIYSKIAQAAQEFKTTLQNKFSGNDNFLFSYVNTTGTTCYANTTRSMAYLDFTGQTGIGHQKDICEYTNADFFNDIKDKLSSIVVAHKYDYWLITTDPSDNIQESTIKVYQHTNDINTTPNPARYTITGYKTNQNTRCAPTAGEPRTGRFIKFNSCADGISYPSCLTISYLGKPVCYRYIVINNEPAVSTIRVWIDGQEINEFSYVGLKYTTDIAENCPGFTSHNAEKKTGYFIRLATPYESGQKMKVTYKGAAKK